MENEGDLSKNDVAVDEDVKVGKKSHNSTLFVF
jgi:hypothetical protein